MDLVDETVGVETTTRDLNDDYLIELARVFDLDDLTMLIGAATDGRLLEIGVTDAEGSNSSCTP